jgi:hypothetical protein
MSLFHFLIHVPDIWKQSVNVQKNICIKSGADMVGKFLVTKQSFPKPMTRKTRKMAILLKML